MVEVAVKIDGLQDTLKMFSELPAKTRMQAIKPALRITARAVRDDAKRILKQHIGNTEDSHSTGLLEKHLTTVTLRDKPGMPVVVLAGIPRKSKLGDELKVLREAEFKRAFARNASTTEILSIKRRHQYPFYWRFLEFGTKKMRARPYLRTALRLNRDHSRAMLKLYLEKFMAAYKAPRSGGASG